MERMMEGKVAVVTGAGGGIGREIALQLAAEGAKVVVNDIGVALNGDDLSAAVAPADAVVAEIRAAGGTAVANFDSVATYASANAIVQCAMDHFGRIDGVVNNAGNLRDRSFHKMSEEEWRAVIAVHLDGTFFVSRAAATHFREQESGAMVHMTSTSGLIGNFGQANYGAAKLGIVALSKMIALDMGRYGVRSNCIAPSAWSRMTSSIPTDTPQQRDRVEKLKKMEAGKIAPMAVYLLSDAAREVSGQIFAVRANEIMLMSQPRPLRSVHFSEGWTPQRIAEVAIPAMQKHFYPLERSPDVMSWDPI
ncbi:MULTISPECIES: SDR family NAD(P)-dependent oxidoreductase [Achromobacter]|jgi:NAD(P)-dependent dehydrogenase (short-subunit alcohol dehydrogenase family)|uniref:Short-chain type dehydrogenase/reductase Rv0148 n=1 Tax=Achromobacter aegrifaciens TaxID=1287736 RepID=A0AAD2J5L7_ACHAE|nr:MULTISPECIES: SDR family NAD(P)-dependent oxidoreductase [Achromobacter]PTN48737.1 KR domain-containing protein [Achromobacter xylosoxidans]MBD9423559.1 SDR family oxidoreductase [Achromobacter sp. ACM04]MDQ1763906.1 SDR family oxidoreductase [Achromobacter aegrifaciens]RIJ02325.1 SDR family oxidoreductase [Achromobacter sp. K91]RSF02966.1 SDR family oxidoreductase [Achromobacter aegrifaciens]